MEICQECYGRAKCFKMPNEPKHYSGRCPVCYEMKGTFYEFTGECVWMLMNSLECAERSVKRLEKHVLRTSNLNLWFAAAYITSLIIVFGVVELGYVNEICIRKMRP